MVDVDGVFAATVSRAVCKMSNKSARYETSDDGKLNF